MRIAICDDDKGTCVELEEIIRKADIENTKMHIDTYHDGEGLLKDFTNGYIFDIIYLDIELPGLNGVRVGEVLREQLHKHRLDLIFISQKGSYCEQLFDLEPRRFYRKPLDETKILLDLKKIIKEKSDYPQSVWYENNGREYRIFLDDVLYVEAREKKVYATDCRGQIIVLKKTLTEWEDIFCKGHFLRCHKSFLVNMDYVSSYSRTEFVMSNGTSIPIGRKYEKITREILNSYKMEEM